MQSRDGRYWLVFNGAIHNYLELQARLRANGHLHASSGDTAVVMAAYQAWGEDCFGLFNGMWALAIWDRQEHRLLLCRDRFGIKPLYYLAEASAVCFASEVKAILGAFPRHSEINQQRVCAYLLGANPDSGEETYYSRIKAVKPAHLLILEPDRLQERCYWELNPGAVSQERDPEDGFRELLADSVKLRLRSDVPLGICVSGGLDSSSVAALAAQSSQNLFPCFSLKYDGHPEIDESSYAADVTARGPFRVHWVTPTSEDLIGKIERIVYYHDAPPPIRGRLSQWALFEMAARHVKVVLVGEGGDELLAGYPRFFLPCLADILRFRWDAKVPPVAEALRTLSGWRNSAGSWGSLLGNAIRPLIRGISPTALSDPCFIDREFATVFGTGLNPGEFFASWWHRGVDRPWKDHQLNNALWQEFRFCLPELLRSEDALGMAFSVEVRPPFLDHRVVEFCFSLDHRAKIRRGMTKSLLRNAMKGVIPERVRLRRDKVGMPTPYRSLLMASPCWEDISRMVLEGEGVRRGILSRTGVEKLLRRFQRSSDPRSKMSLIPVWKCLCLELWLKQQQELVPSPR